VKRERRRRLLADDANIAQSTRLLALMPTNFTTVPLTRTESSATDSAAVEAESDGVNRWRPAWPLPMKRETPPG